jgi:hypothetical protein
LSPQVYNNKYTYITDKNFGKTFASCSLPNPAGFYLDIVENSTTTTYPLYCYAKDTTTGVITTGKTLTMNFSQGPQQLNVCKTKCTSDTDTCDWAFFDILGQQISFTVDLSQIPCNYNLTFYSATLHTGESYCDAQRGCTEVDFMEANLYAWHTTMHIKTDPGGTPIGYGGTITQYTPQLEFLDVSGKVTDPSKLYGPGLLIDTTKAFNVVITFSVDNENILTEIKLVLTQDTNQIYQIYPYNEEYFMTLSQQLQNTDTSGNVFVMSLWTGSFGWLQTPPCPQYQYKPDNNDITGTISDIVVTPL